jgi:hypothetical protein
MDEFPRMAEWLRRHKLELVRSGAPSDELLKPCILCLRRVGDEFQHYYSVSPDLEVEPGGPGSALIWSSAILGCDEYFLLTDNGKRILVQRFTKGDSAYDPKTGYPVKPPYPTTASYYYEQEGTRLVWREVFAKELDETAPTTWDLWHCFLAGWKIGHDTWPSVQESIDAHADEEGMTPFQRQQMIYQGRARFVSTCGGVKAVACSNLAAAGLNKLISFQKGEPFKLTREEDDLPGEP